MIVKKPEEGNKMISCGFIQIFILYNLKEKGQDLMRKFNFN